VKLAGWILANLLVPGDHIDLHVETRRITDAFHQVSAISLSIAMYESSPNLRDAAEYSANSITLQLPAPQRRVSVSATASSINHRRHTPSGFILSQHILL
jgi:hypothetical protein